MSGNKKFEISPERGSDSSQRADEGASTPAVSHYRINVGLCVALVILVPVYFYWHIQPIVVRLLLQAGIPLALLLWISKRLSSYFSDPVIADKDSLVKRFLKRSSATGYLFAALGLVIVSMATTSSIYVEYDDVDREFGEYQIEVKYKQQLFLKPLTVSSYDPIKGRPFFFKLSRLFEPIKLRFSIARPFGYEIVERDFRLWSRIHLSIPGDTFAKKTYRIVRLMPGWTLLQTAPRVDVSDSSSYFLVIRFNGNKYDVEDVLMETVYFGAQEEIIESMIEAEPSERRYVFLRNYLTKIGWNREPEERARILASSYRTRETEELQEGQAIIVEVRKKLEDGKTELLSETSFTVHDRPGIQNFPLK
jgi:hypothetical protein